jgi:hypothetical protein
MEREKLYVKYSVPLLEAEGLIIGEEYFNEEGHCFKYVGNEKFEFVKQSPLHFGERVTELHKVELLRLFWI